MKRDLTIEGIRAAGERIKPYVYKTPLEKSIYLSDDKTDFYLKLENLQTVKSFKIRGALNSIMCLSDEEKKRGIAATSSGNHAVAVAYAASLLGIENTVVIVPETTPVSKVEKIEYYGGKVMLMGKNYDEAHVLGDRFIEAHGYTYIDGWDANPGMYEGSGTISLEILEQNPDIDTIVVQIGGGGLSTGIAVAAKALKPGIRVIGVQTEACPAYVRSIEDDRLYYEYDNSETVCDALIGGIGHLAFDMRGCMDEVLVVSEENIKRAVKHCMVKEKIIPEPAGAVTVAAVMQYREKFTGKNTALIISGGNIDEKLMVEILNKY